MVCGCGSAQKGEENIFVPLLREDWTKLSRSEKFGTVWLLGAMAAMLIAIGKALFEMGLFLVTNGAGL